MKATSTIWPLAIILAGGLIIRKQQQVKGCKGVGAFSRELSKLEVIEAAEVENAILWSPALYAKAQEIASQTEDNMGWKTKEALYRFMIAEMPYPYNRFDKAVYDFAAYSLTGTLFSIRHGHTTREREATESVRQLEGWKQIYMKDNNLNFIEYDFV